MQSSTAVVRGTVSQRGAANDEGAGRPLRTGEVQINLVSGTSSFAVTSASKPDNRLGQFEIDGVPPGTYTLSVNRRGTSPTSTIITLAAGEVRVYNPVLAAPAQISGVVATAGGQVRPGWLVQLYLASQYPTVIARTVTTDSAGRYVLPDVDAPQSYVIEARPTASAAAQGSVTRQINASQQLTADITVPEPGRLTAMTRPRSMPAFRTRRPAGAEPPPQATLRAVSRTGAGNTVVVELGLVNQADQPRMLTVIGARPGLVLAAVAAARRAGRGRRQPGGRAGAAAAVGHPAGPLPVRGRGAGQRPGRGPPARAPPPPRWPRARWSWTSPAG